MTRSEPSRGIRFLKLVLLFAVLHYVALLVLSGLIFLVERVPPKAVNLDGVMTALVAMETVLVAPRKIVLWLWPWETTPSGFRFALTLINSITWGAGLAGLRAFWRKAIR